MNSFGTTVRRIAKRGALATVVFASATAYVNRPRGSWETEYYEKMRGKQPQLSAPEQFLQDVAHFMAVAPTVTVFKILCGILNKPDIEGLDTLREWIDPKSRDGRGLITVSNHVSILDDPGLMSVILPYSVAWRPRTMRLGVCSEELCFFNPFVGAYIGSGGVVPVKRGGSVFQKFLVDFQDRVHAGGWAHIFPEGRCWQEGGNPLRDEQGRWCSESGRCGNSFGKLGPMKWGIAKVIANAEKPPVVVPYYHLGMENVMPQDSNNDIVSSVPSIGHELTVKVGEPIDFSDLLKAYFKAADARAQTRANLRKAEAKGDSKVEEVKAVVGPVFEACHPPSRFRLRVLPPDHAMLTEQQLAEEDAIRYRLYSAISTRIHDKLALLEDQVRARRRERGIESLEDKQW